MPLEDQPVPPKVEAAQERDAELAGGPIDARALRADSPEVVEQLDRLIESFGGKKGSFNARMIRDLLQTSLKLIPDGRDTGELKLMANALKEMRYAYRVFGRYVEPHKVTIFGSARTPETHPDYAAAVEFSKLMHQAGWMSITGAGMGIMKAGHVGPGRDASFGVAIRLPFETNANEVIKGDEKLINFRYFFTRKLMFVSQAEAVALFPGGFGTMDEAYETLTLVQTGKSAPMPIVMVEGAGGDYWRSWERFTIDQLLKRGWISPEDQNIYSICDSPAQAAQHILGFYRNYHSSRYVRDDFVIRLRRPLSPEALDRVNDEFKVLVKQGKIEQRGPLDGEDDHLELPRLCFTHTKHKYGLIRRLIDRANQLA